LLIYLDLDIEPLLAYCIYIGAAVFRFLITEMQ